MSLRLLTAQGLRHQTPSSKLSLTAPLKRNPLPLKTVKPSFRSFAGRQALMLILRGSELMGSVRVFRRRRFGRIKSILPMFLRIFKAAEVQAHRHLRATKTALYIKSELLILMIKKLLLSIWRNLKTNLHIRTENIVLL